MKIKPVVDALEARSASVQLVHTGQHFDERMSSIFFDELGLRPPDHWLGAGPGSHAEQTAAVMLALEPLLAAIAADVMVVVGDVNSTLAAALVAAKGGTSLAHVEAGLRSRDRTMPEEANRVVTDHLSDFLFAPSPDAVDNLLAEGIPPGRVHLVGNVMVDTLLANLGRARARPALADLGLAPQQYGVVTLHRPANVDDPAVLVGLLGVLGELGECLPLVLPAHPRTAARLAQATAAMPPGLRILPPLGYLDFLALEASARLVLTDSGGVQEETTVLGVPCLTLRENTERPSTVTHGTNTVVGRDRSAILAAAQAAISSPPVPRRPALWDGHAAERIADVLVAGFSRSPAR